jgi:hypothetical protein
VRLVRRGSGARGQTGTEYMLVVSVIVIAVVAAAYVFVPRFGEGVTKLGADVKDILSNGDVGGVGRGGGNAVNGAQPGMNEESGAANGGGPWVPP